MPKILVTGGAGYIGSHVSALLLTQGYEVVVVDDFSNARREVIDNINAIGGREVSVETGDCRDTAFLARVFSKHEIAGVIHMAGLKAVAESVARPSYYYLVNLGTAAALLETMQAHQVDRLVFSSSATVYGNPKSIPVDETAALAPINPYGRTKYFIEQMLEDLSASGGHIRAVSLRYFNPVGAHPSALIGEDPSQPPQNLFPIIAEVAAGKRGALDVFGNDWGTHDGSCIRDYIHVMDLAEAHIAALEHLSASEPGHVALNLGRGHGISVLEAAAAFQKATGVEVPLRIGPRRAGDVASVVANASKAREVLGWRTTRDLDQMCADQWAWQRTRTG